MPVHSNAGHKSIKVFILLTMLVKKKTELFGVKCEHGVTGYNYWVAFHRLIW